MDSARFPTTAAYLDRLPEGVHSHPQCTVKASVLRDAMTSRPLLPEDLEAMPEVVADLVRNPRPVSVWIPEVPALTAMLAVRDRFFDEGPGGLDAYENWTYERNRRLLARPLYRALFLLISPARLLRGVGGRWSAFRRGTELVLRRSEPGLVHLRTEYPSFLNEETVGRGLVGAVRAAVELSGGRDVTVDVLRVGEQSSEFEIRYRR